MLLDVCLYRQEILMDEGGDFIIRVGFGLQPNARASGRSRAEIKQQGHLSGPSLGERRINLFIPLDSHFPNLLKT